MVPCPAAWRWLDSLKGGIQAIRQKNHRSQYSGIVNLARNMSLHILSHHDETYPHSIGNRFALLSLSESLQFTHGPLNLLKLSGLSPGAQFRLRAWKPPWVRFAPFANIY